MIYYYREQKVIYNKLLLKLEIICAHKYDRKIAKSTDAIFVGNHVSHLAKLNTCILPLISVIYFFRIFCQFPKEGKITSDLETLKAHDDLSIIYLAFALDHWQLGKYSKISDSLYNQPLDVLNQGPI